MRLGIDESIFERIICFETLNPHLFSDDASSPTTDQTVVLKPSPLAFHAAIKIAGYDPHRMVCVYLCIELLYVLYIHMQFRCMLFVLINCKLSY